jgi:hypothetical protein
MSDFAWAIVNGFNRFFKTHQIQGFAYRLKQNTSTCRSGDVLVDSRNPSYCLSIVCKSIIDKKLYFSQHFHSDKKKVHQVDIISDFLARTGRPDILLLSSARGQAEQQRPFLSLGCRLLCSIRIIGGFPSMMRGKMALH